MSRQNEVRGDEHRGRGTHSNANRTKRTPSLWNLPMRGVHRRNSPQHSAPDLRTLNLSAYGNQYVVNRRRVLSMCTV